MLILAVIIILIDIVPLIKKRQKKEAAVLLMLGSITLAYGYYYNTHIYSASLLNIVFRLFHVH